jgi:hypothetical protein
VIARGAAVASAPRAAPFLSQFWPLCADLCYRWASLLVPHKIVHSNPPSARGLAGATGSSLRLATRAPIAASPRLRSGVGWRIRVSDFLCLGFQNCFEIRDSFFEFPPSTCPCQVYGARAGPAHRGAATLQVQLIVVFWHLCRELYRELCRQRLRQRWRCWPAQSDLAPVASAARALLHGDCGPVRRVVRCAQKFTNVCEFFAMDTSPLYRVANLPSRWSPVHVNRTRHQTPLVRRSTSTGDAYG